jgi:hypothetical protein
LLIGERTKLFQDWSDDHQMQYQSIINFIREKFGDRKVVFKPRKSLTDIGQLDLAGYQIIDSENSLEELFIHQKFSKVISIKSTGSKLASYFGYPGYLLYPIFKFPQIYLDHIQPYFADVNTLIRVTKTGDLHKVPKENFSFPSKEQTRESYFNFIVEPIK